jgi:Glycosyl hydrolases family 43.
MAQSIVAGSSTQKEKSLLSNFQKDPDAYVFSYFTGNGEDGLHLMYSHDGIIWQTLNHGNSLLKPTIGKEKLMRDPSIVRDMQGIYHMVWTTGWNGNSIGYASSKDLINWSEQAEIPVMANEPTVRNTLAPELLYDKLSGKFYIVWASTIPGRFPENGKSEDGYNHRLYYTTTKDFKKFEKTSLLYDPGFSVIDACFLKKKGTYYMFLKNETLDPVEKNIRYTSAGRMKGFPKEVSGPISGKAWAEGPTAVQIRDYTYIYWDNYTEGHYGGVRCRNLSKPQWEDITGIIRFPKGVRHGSAFKIDNKTLVNLQNLEK